MNESPKSSPRIPARRVAAAITAILVAGSSLDRALAEELTVARAQASRHETRGVLSGFAIGAAAGGPVGALLGAAGGGWLGDRMHRESTRVRILTQGLQTERAEGERLRVEVALLNTVLTESQTQFATQLANSLPLDEFAAKVHFRTNAAVLDSADQEQMRKLGALLSGRTERKIHVTGFADARGASGYNYELATARAEAVADALVEGGLTRDQLAVTGAGAPANSDCLRDTDSCAFERRATVSLLDSGIDAGEDLLAQVLP